MVAISSVAVVPIFVNAGAALLPALLAGMASLVALLLSPRAMMRLCRRKPWLPVVVVAIGFGAYFFPRMLAAKGTGGGGGAGGTAGKVIDWAGIGRDMVRQERTPQAILTLRWHNDLDGAMALSTPVLDVHEKGSGTLYVTTTLFDVGNKYGTLEAINAADGTVLWTATKDGAGQYLKPFFSSPAVATGAGGEKYLVVGQGLHDDKDCPLMCWRLGSGDGGGAAAPPIAWAVPTPLHVESSPALFSRNGELRAVVGAGAIEGKDRLAVGNPGYVFCVSVGSGKELWKFPLNDAESSPAVDGNGVVYIGSGFNGNAVVALRSEADEELAGKPRQVWRRPTAFPAVGDVTLAEDRQLGKMVLIGAGNGDYVYSDPKPAGVVLALAREDGRVLWGAPMPDSVLGRLTVVGSHVLAPCRDGQAYALELSTGRVLWHRQISATPGIPVLAGLATDGMRAFSLAADGTLAVLSVSSGEVLERVKLSDETKAPQNLSVSTPLYHDGTLYVATETMGLRAYKVGP